MGKRLVQLGKKIEKLDKMADRFCETNVLKERK